MHAGSHLGRHPSCDGQGMMDMRAGFTLRPLHLNVGELLEVSDGKGLAVRCLEGRVWITQSDDQRDIVLGQARASCLMCPALPSFARPPPPRYSQLKHRSRASSRRTAGPWTMPQAICRHAPRACDLRKGAGDESIYSNDLHHDSREDDSRQSSMREIMQMQALDSPRHVRDRANETVCRSSPRYRGYPV